MNELEFATFFLAVADDRVPPGPEAVLRAFVSELAAEQHIAANNLPFTT